jgi:hypothetical protein
MSDANVIRSFSCSSHLEHRAPFGVSVIKHILRHAVGFLDECVNVIATSQIRTDTILKLF